MLPRIHAGEVLTLRAGSDTLVVWRPDWHDRTGRFDLLADDQPILRDLVSVIDLNGSAIRSDDSRYSRSSRSANGRLVVNFSDSGNEIDLELHITPAGDTAVIVELTITNRSARQLNIGAADLFRAQVDLPSLTKVLTNGYIYYDSGKLLDFSADKTRAVDSFWNATFYSPDPRQALVVGYVENDIVEGHIQATRAAGASGPIGVLARSNLHRAFLLPPGKSVSCGKVFVALSADPWAALEAYADEIGKPHRVKLNPVINGWCSWFVYYGGVSEAEVLKNAEFIARELKPYGMDWVQIDDGYYRAFGDWEGNDRFPNGMKHTADEIRKLGLKPGLWVAPYAISENTDIAKSHPEWLAHDEKGELQKIEAAHAGQAQYILDITHPGARQWLADLFKTIAQDWGYDFIKTDFVEWTLLAAQKLHDPNMTKAQAYRLGDQIMREQMGPSRHLLDCGPGNEVVGLLDSMRIGLDRPDDLPNFKLWEQYSGHANSTIPSVAKRYFFHNRTWINDPDHLRTAKLTVPQAQAAATIIALSGGTTISGDKLYELDRERLDIIRKVLPSFGQAARPLDLFDNPLAELFALPVHTGFEDWTVLAAFNGADSPAQRRLRLEGPKPKVVYDFWAQKLLADDATDGIDLNIAPTSVALLAVRDKSDVPQLLGTDRHVLAGAIELDKLHWDAAANTLSGVALGKAPMQWRLAIYLPGGYRFDPSESAAATGLSDINLDGRVLRAGVKFAGSSERIDWSLRFSKT